jgi:hypothetical protein
MATGRCPYDSNDAVRAVRVLALCRWQIHGSFSNTAVAKIIQQNKTVFVRRSKADFVPVGRHTAPFTTWNSDLGKNMLHAL